MNPADVSGYLNGLSECVKIPDFSITVKGTENAALTRRVISLAMTDNRGF